MIDKVKEHFKKHGKKYLIALGVLTLVIVGYKAYQKWGKGASKKPKRS